MCVSMTNLGLTPMWYQVEMAPKDFIEGVKGPDCPTANGVQATHQPISKPVQELGTTAERQPLKWLHIVAIIALHVTVLITAIPTLLFCTWGTYFFSLFYGILAGFGVTGGAHRLWAHRTFTAALPLRIILAICFSIAGQNTIPQWVLDHRVHHRYSETNADPHNSNRGFFFAHVGWLMQKKHPDVLAKGKRVDMSDIYADPLVVYHTKFFIPLKILFCFIVPTLVPHYAWGETLTIAFLANLLRYTATLNATWLVNSAAHIYGYHPYSTRIKPAENKLVAIVSLGEGWHNYHHVFPWDYRAAELGGSFLNITTAFLDTFAKIGWATNLKKPNQDYIDRVALKHGDGSHQSGHHHPREVNEDGEEVATDCEDVATDCQEPEITVQGDEQKDR